MDDAFSRLYRAFGRFGCAPEIIPMSAGINWLPASQSLVRLLQWELDSGVSHRHYGRSVGPHAVTQILRYCELEAPHCPKNIRCMLTSGTTDAAVKFLTYLFNEKLKGQASRMLAIGPIYPHYSRAADFLGIDYVELSLPADSPLGQNVLLHDIEHVVNNIEKVRPQVIVLLLPSNPYGILPTKDYLDKLALVCENFDIHVLVDRVCMLDYEDHLYFWKSFSKLFDMGLLAVADSFSKQQSLAGLRVGYLISDEEVERSVERQTQFQCLNPPMFGSLTLAVSAILRSRNKESLLRLWSIWRDRILVEFKEDERPSRDLSELEPIFQQYKCDSRINRKTISMNYKRLYNQFGNSTKLEWQGGFNVVLELPNMISSCEDTDQVSLINQGVGLLTSSQFTTGINNRNTYFGRVGLAIDSNLFDKGCTKIASFYGGK